MTTTQFVDKGNSTDAGNLSSFTLRYALFAIPLDGSRDPHFTGKFTGGKPQSRKNVFRQIHCELCHGVPLFGIGPLESNKADTTKIV